MRGLARQKILTVEVTVAASSSYVGFLESYAQALVAADTPVGAAEALDRRAAAARSSPELRFDRRPAAGTRASSRSAFPRSAPRATPPASPPKCSRCRRASPRRASSAWPSRSTSSRPSPSFDGGTRRERAARRGAGPAPGRLRVLRLRAVADGAHARAAPAVLQGRAGDAPREDRPGRLRGLHRRAVPRQRHPARGRARRSDRRSRRQRALRRAAPRARNLGRRERGRQEDGGPRRSARRP